MSDNINIKVTETLENIFLKASETEERITISVDETLEDIVIVAQEARDGEKGDTGDTGPEGRHIESASFVGNDIVFVNDDATTVILEDAKIELKGDKGDKGDSGTNGTNGNDGEDGYTPIKGVDYFDGTNGINGTNGTNGLNGYTPIKGVDYFDGEDSTIPGPQGAPGYTPIKGVDYFDGEKGDKGDPGLNGSDAEVTKTNIKLAMDGDYESFIRILSTGIKEGGGIHQNIGFINKFDVEAGAAVFVDAHTDPLNPTITHVEWDEIVGVTATYLATDATTYVRIDKDGVISQSPYTCTEVERRDLVEIGWIDHPDNTNMDFFYQEPATNINLQSQFNDFLEAFRQFNVSGNDYSAASTNLTIKRSAGRTFDNNANYATDIRNPHIIDTEIESPCDIYYYYRDTVGWVNDSAVVTNIDPDHWDNGSGTLQNVPSGEWTIQLISFYAVYESNDIQYGQVTYATYEAALASLKEAVEINPYNEADTFRAWLIIKQGATDLSNPAQAVFKSGGKFGLNDAGSGSIGGSGGEVNTASNIGDYGTGIYKTKSGVTLQFKNLRGIGVIGLTDNTTDDTVEIALTEDATHRLVTDTEKSTWNAGSKMHITFALAIGTDATIGNNKTNQIVIPRAGSISKCWINAKTAPVGADLICDINKGGTTIWTTQANRIKLTAGNTSGSQTSFDVTSVVEGDIITIDIDQVGSSTAGKDITVILQIS